MYRVDIQENWITQLTPDTEYKPGKNATAPTSREGYRLEEVAGGMKVQSSDWTHLTYSGKMFDNRYDKNSSDYAKSGFKADNPPNMTFSVYGDVAINSKEIGISGLNTPFGELQMKFDFAKSEMTGSLAINADIPLPPVIIKSGQIDMKLSPKGFYLVGALKSFVGIPIIQGTYNMGFMIGHYPDKSEIEKIWPKVESLKNPKLRNDCYVKNVIDYKLSGFYFTIDRDLFNAKLNQNFVVAWGNLMGYAGISADIFANFSPVAVGVSAAAKLEVDCEVGSIVGTTIEGSLRANGSFGFLATGSGFEANVNLDMGISVKVKQCVPLTGICATLLNETIGCEAAGGTSGFSFKFGSGLPTPKCPY